jgi:sodium-dependent phosphate cotransporter
MFNLSGTVIVYVPPPIRRIPIVVARALGRLTVRNRLYAIAYVVVLFFLLPFLLILLSGTF